MGSLTDFSAVSMLPIELFNKILEANLKNLKTEHEQQKLIKIANGIDPHDGNKQSDWRIRFFENLPFKADDSLVINLSRKINPMIEIDDSKSSPFVYAGFLKPGRH